MLSPSILQAHFLPPHLCAWSTDGISSKEKVGFGVSQPGWDGVLLLCIFDNSQTKARWMDG